MTTWLVTLVLLPVIVLISDQHSDGTFKGQPAVAIELLQPPGTPGI
jgi:hypothetical protein